MKKLFAISLSTAVLLGSSVQSNPNLDMGELHLDLTGPEYRALIENLEAQSFVDLSADELSPILDLGKRNLDWLEVINKARPEGKKLELSTPATQVGIPIDAPRESNRTIIKQSLAAVKAELPSSMKDVLFSSVALPSEVPAEMTDEQFLLLARKVDRVYQGASRWLLQEPYLFWYEQYRAKDIRGYYFLSKEKEIEAKLQAWKDLSADTQAKYSEWLIGMCINSAKEYTDCKTQLLESLERSGNALYFYNRYLKTAKQSFDSNYELKNPRRDIDWTSARPEIAVMAFQTPASQEIQDWLAVNIEDEWRVPGWNLKLQFSPSASAHVVFQPGATPNVNGLGGNRITMDANRSIHEYSTRWTIRHEFGHVIGLPDCYIEFFDRDRGVMINYQIDTSDLMCSRTGHLQQHHYEQLKKHYFRNAR